MDFRLIIDIEVSNLKVAYMNKFISYLKLIIEAIIALCVLTYLIYGHTVASYMDTYSGREKTCHSIGFLLLHTEYCDTPYSLFLKKQGFVFKTEKWILVGYHKQMFGIIWMYASPSNGWRSVLPSNFYNSLMGPSDDFSPEFITKEAITQLTLYQIYVINFHKKDKYKLHEKIDAYYGKKLCKDTIPPPEGFSTKKLDFIVQPDLTPFNTDQKDTIDVKNE